jgi:hypothetical protein
VLADALMPPEAGLFLLAYCFVLFVLVGGILTVVVLARSRSRERAREIDRRTQDAGWPRGAGRRLGERIGDGQP